MRALIKLTNIALASLLLVGCASNTPSPPVTQADPAQADSTQANASNNPAANNPLAVLDELSDVENELKRLRNLVEKLQFDLETSSVRRQSLMHDMERRLLALERARAAAPNAQSSGAQVNADVNTNANVNANANAGANSVDENVIAQAGTVSVQEQQAYDRAKKILQDNKERNADKYQDAINAFGRFVEQWPQSQLADDALYWAAESRYANHQFADALAGFRAVLADYPNSQLAPEALLKVGYTQYSMRRYDAAARIFRDILQRYPAHRVATSAKIRLRRIEQNIQ